MRSAHRFLGGALLREAERKKGQTPSAEHRALCAWNVCITNLTEHQATVKDVLVLARARWQIELIFKRWKSHGCIDTWSVRRPDAILCHVYAKMIAMVIQHWQVLTSLWTHPERSLRQAVKAIQKSAFAMLIALWDWQHLTDVLNALASGLEHGCVFQRQAKKPSTFQLLLDVSLLDVEYVFCGNAP